MVDVAIPIFMMQPLDYPQIITVIHHFFPYWVIISVGVILFHWTGLKIFYQIDRLFGIDLRSKNLIRTGGNKCRLEALFRKKKENEKEEPFRSYQEFALKHLRWTGITIGAAIIAIIIVILSLDIPYTFGLDPRINHFPRIVDNEVKAFIYRLNIIILNIIWFWILFSGIGTLLLVLSIGKVFGEMNKYQGLTIEDIKSVSEKNYPKLSINRFKRRYDDVPNFLTKISIVISIELFLIVCFITYYGSLFEAYKDNVTVPTYIMDICEFCVGAGPLLVVLLITTSIILLIITPQWSFHSLLVEVKESILDTLEELYEEKKCHYLERTRQRIHQENNDDGNTLLQEVKTLKDMINDIEKISTLPFKENHIITVVSSMVLPFIPLFTILKDIATSLISLVST